MNTGLSQRSPAMIATKLHSSSRAMLRWWANSWRIVAGIRQAGASSLIKVSAVKGKKKPVKSMRLIRGLDTMRFGVRSGPARKGNSAQMPS